MKKRIKEYIDLIFADAPDCARTREMKEEMYANVCDRYDDLVREGKSESAAYNISISGIGDISELIESIKAEHGDKSDVEEAENPYSNNKKERIFTSEEKAEIEKYRVRKGIMNSIAIALYILCWVPLVIISTVSEAMGGSENVSGVVGILVMMLMIAAATVLMVMQSSIKPLYLRGVKFSETDDDDDDDDDDDAPKNKKAKKIKNPVLRAISGALWTVTVVVFLLLGFLLEAWHPGWIVFLITTAVDNIIESIFELKGKKYVLIQAKAEQDE